MNSSVGHPRTAPVRTRDRLLAATRLMTFPLLPDDFLGPINPLWSREPRGRVESVRPVGPSTTELTIRPGDGWAGHRPGQHVGVGVELAGRWHGRTYSPTSLPGDDLTIAVTAVPDGSVSSHLARITRPGDLLRLAPAAGEFVLDEDPGPLLMVTGGSGITPVLGMLRAAGDDLDAVVVHSGRTTDALVHGDELRALAAERPGLRLHARHTALRGRLTTAALVELVPDWRDRTTYVCGPASLIDAMVEHHTAAGVPVRYERFQPPAPVAAGTGGTVTFSRSGIVVAAGPTTPLLHAGEDAGALLPSGCRMGICHTCVGRLRVGAVRDLQTGEEHSAPAYGDGEPVRTCVSAAAGDVEIDL